MQQKPWMMQKAQMFVHRRGKRNRSKYSDLVKNMKRMWNTQANVIPVISKGETHQNGFSIACARHVLKRNHREGLFWEQIWKAFE
jgi:hypothetical protein